MILYERKNKQMMRESKLSEHKFKKGKFITPMNQVLGDILKTNPWFHTRLPEYFWLGLVVNYYGRDEGLIKCNQLLKYIAKYSNSLDLPKMSNILSLSEQEQLNLYNNFLTVIDKEVLAPLTIIFTYTKYPTFASCFLSDLSIDERLKYINETMEKTSDHQSELSTDIRFLILVYLIKTGHLSMQKDNLMLLSQYSSFSHNDKEMCLIRPLIRASEIAIPIDTDECYLNIFWEGVSRMTDCELFFVETKSNHENSEDYISYVKETLSYYTDMFTATRPLDNKMLVILGIATYSYKRLLELVEHNLYKTIVGRSIVRILVENYIMLKYLLLNESKYSNIWSEYQQYGIGQYKLIVERYRESEEESIDSHVEYKYMDLLVNEYINKEFTDMDTSYFDKKNVREKAIEVGEKSLFGLLYDYDSAFEHGLWGAIRESSLLKCNSVSHQYHCVPDIENQQDMNDVWSDCKKLMDKILAVLENVYGIPDSLKNGDTDDK